MVAKGSKTITSSNDAELLQLLKEKIAELEARQNNSSGAEIGKIQQDDYIPVMSLLPYNLNLSTKAGGQGNIKKFTKFGEIKKILYRDLVEIMETNPGFVESGYFYILDPAVIRQHGLDDIYSRILTKEKIEDIVSTGSDEAIALYSSANANQQEIIVQLLVERVRDNPDSVNLNIIDKISRLSKVDITKKAEEEREMIDATFEFNK